MKLGTRLRYFAAALTGRALDAAGGGKRWPAGSLLRHPAAAMRVGAEPVAARAAHYALNNPYGAQIPEVLASSLIGETGPRAQSGHPDREIARELDRAWTRFERACGVNGESLADLLRQSVFAFAQAGEAFLQFQPDDEDRLRLTLLDAEQVDRSRTSELGGGARTIQGVEFDAAGRVVRYWVFPDRPGEPFGATLASMPLPASELLHLVRPWTPGQVRGLSVFAPILTRLAEIDAIEDAQLARVKVSALFAGFITDPDNGAAEMPGEASAGVLESGLEPGVLKVLRPGQGIEFPSTPQVGDAMVFLKTQLRAVAAGAGITYQQLTGDLSDTNYSSIRAGLLEHQRRMGAFQRQVFEPRVLDPLWRRFVTMEVLAGRIKAPGFTTNPEPWFDVSWLWPAWPSVDPKGEVEAEVNSVNAGFKSRREVIAASGRDPETVAAVIAEERAAASQTPQTMEPPANAA